MSTENKQSNYFHIAIVVLLAINIIVSVLAMRSSESIEIMKVGGKENYDKLQVIMQSEEYKNQYAQNLELMLQQIQGGGTQEELQNIPNENSTVSGETLENVQSGSIVDNNISQGDE